MKIKEEENKQKRFFDKNKNQYDFKLIKNPPLYVQKETDFLLSKVNNLKINQLIEFGSGTGRLTIPLLKNNYKVNAVDISRKSLAKLKQIAKKLKLDKKLKLYQCINTLIQSGIITGCDILHHIDLQKYLPLIYNKLNKGGTILFSEPNPLNISWLIYISLFADWKVEKGIFDCNYFNLKNKLKKYGFKDIKIEGFGLFPNPLFNWSRTLLKLNILLGNLPIFKIFSYRLIIFARK